LKGRVGSPNILEFLRREAVTNNYAELIPGLWEHG